MKKWKHYASDFQKWIHMQIASEKLNTFFLPKIGITKKYNEICEKSSNIIQKAFDSHPVYNEKSVKTKINLYCCKIMFSLSKNTQRNLCVSIS